VPAGWTGHPDVLAAELAARLRSLGDRLAQADARAIAEARIDRFLSTRNPVLRGALVDQVALEAVDDTTAVRRRPGSVCELRTRGDRLVVLLGDRRLEMPRWLEPAMRRIQGADILRAGDLVPEIPDADGRAVLVRRLVREGLLRPIA
jgi:hypothetical protein